MKKHISIVITFLLTLGAVVATATPSQAATVNCSVSGSFTINGTVVESSTSDCAGTVEIPSSVTYIGISAFAQRNITGVTFASNGALTRIGETAFYLTKLTSVVIPNTVTAIDYAAFYHIPELTSLTFAPGSRVTVIGNSAFYYTGITSVVIPASVVTIEQGGFAGWPSLSLGLRSVSFEAGSALTTIGVTAFDGSYFSSVTLPAGVTSIARLAFADSPSLTSIVFTGNAPATVHAEAFIRTGDIQNIRAIRASNLTGFGVDGATWNGLLVSSPDVPCTAGTFSASGNAPCTPAPIGRFVASSGATVSQPCVAGTYQNQTGQLGCITASAGFYVADSGASTQTACATGYTSAAGAIACTLLAAPIVIAPNPNVLKTKTSVISGFSSKGVQLTSAMKSKIKAFVLANKTHKSLKCAGVVKGVARSSTQLKLAKDRAKAVCAYAKTQNKKLVTSYSGGQSATKGSVARLVNLTIKP